MTGLDAHSGIAQQPKKPAAAGVYGKFDFYPNLSFNLSFNQESKTRERARGRSAATEREKEIARSDQPLPAPCLRQVRGSTGFDAQFANRRAAGTSQG
jgi:hypothetical protein